MISPSEPWDNILISITDGITRLFSLSVDDIMQMIPTQIEGIPQMPAGKPVSPQGPYCPDWFT